MSRWYRAYAGMVRDDKLVRVALRSKQSIERVVWIWAAILESAAEIDDDGRYDFDTAEAAYFLRADEADIAAIEAELETAGRLADSRVVKWGDRQFKSDKSAERQRKYRERQKGADDVGVPQRNSDSDGRVTSPSRHRDAPETETETDIPLSSDNGAKPPAPDEVMFASGVQMLTAKGQSDKSARSLLGKWRKTHGTADVIAALGAAQREGAIEPVAFIEQALRRRARDPTLADVPIC